MSSEIFRDHSTLICIRKLRRRLLLNTRISVSIQIPFGDLYYILSTDPALHKSFKVARWRELEQRQLQSTLSTRIDRTVEGFSITFGLVIILTCAASIETDRRMLLCRINSVDG